LTGRGPTSSLFMLAKRQASKQRSKQKKGSKRCAYRVCKQAKKKCKQAAFYCVSVTPTRNVFFCVCNVISEAIIHVCKALGKQAKINKQAMNASKQ